MSDSVATVAKIKLKVGSMELEYEGAPEFLMGGIEALLETMGGLASKVPASASVPPASIETVSREQVAIEDSILGNASASNGAFNFSTNTIAAHLNVQSGPELVICAMAELEFVRSQASSSRAEILKEMQTAKSYYKESMSGNLSSSLNRLVKSKRINMSAKDTYALSASERKQLEAKLADIG